MGSPIVNIDPRIEENRRRRMMMGNSPMNTGGLMLPPMNEYSTGLYDPAGQYNPTAPVNSFTVGMDTREMPVTPMPPVPVGNPFITGTVNPDIMRNVPAVRPTGTLMPEGNIERAYNMNRAQQPIQKPISNYQSSWSKGNAAPQYNTGTVRPAQSYPSVRPGTGMGGLAPRKPMSMSDIGQEEQRKRSMFSRGGNLGTM